MNEVCGNPDCGVVCKEPRVCSQCNATPYCSRKCQKRHWQVSILIVFCHLSYLCRYSCLPDEVKYLNTSNDVVSGAQEGVQIIEQRERAAIPSPRSQQNQGGNTYTGSDGWNAGGFSGKVSASLNKPGV